jgi:hypothetical protein
MMTCMFCMKSCLSCNRKISFLILCTVYSSSFYFVRSGVPISVHVRGSISAVAGVQLDPPGLVQLLSSVFGSCSSSVTCSA